MYIYLYICHIHDKNNGSCLHDIFVSVSLIFMNILGLQN